MPFVGIACGVKYAVDGHRAFDILVEDRLWKAARQPPTIVLVDKSMYLGRAEDRRNIGIEAAQKLLAQADPPTLVPGIHLCEVLLGLRRDE
jgi:hypothetical protein